MTIGIYGPIDGDEALNIYRRLGVEAVYSDIEGITELDVTNAKRHGLKLYAAVWTFKTQNLDFGVLGLDGERRLWAGAGCPNNPNIIKQSIRNIDAAARLGVDGIVLDGVRFPSPASGRNLFLTCFCEYCVWKAKELGCEPSKIKEAMQRTLDPTVLLNQDVERSILKDWVTLRINSITDQVSNIVETIKASNPRLEVGAALFTPSLADLVGQSYRELSAILDFIQPMIYHKGSGLACINFELANLVSNFTQRDSEAETLEKIYKSLSYSRLEPPVDLDKLLMTGLPVQVISLEAAKGLNMVRGGKAKYIPIVLILESDAEELKETVEEVLKARPGGVVYFSYYEGLDDVLPFYIPP
ncbi:hypothetical protein KEJ51_08195, partial [Candidatus Bathyarchaeota archaeon]|nr:hypothetical protein [Candidatus Bathyarchaeota archaeon]